jgi:hypothetical protein
MSNIALFQSGSVIPDYLRNVADDTTRELAGSSGGKSISIKGGVWRMMVGGEEIAKNEDRSMPMVIIATSKGTQRMFYAEKYEEGKDIRPSCWSSEGMVPNDEVLAESRQSANCATCPQNIEGSGEGKARACRFSKRIAVTLENDIGGNVYRLNVPAKSLFGRPDGDKMPLQAYGKFLSGHGIPITGVVTEARFDTGEAVPVLKFRAVRPLSEQEWNTAKAQSASDDVRAALELRFAPKKDNAPALPAAFAEAPVPAKKAKVEEPTDESVEEPVMRPEAKG